MLEIKIKSITTYTNVYVATNLITSILLGNDWINTNHIHLFGDQQQLTIPDQYGQRITISYVEPTFINQPALLVNQITLPPYSQTLVDITCRIYNDKDLTFEPQPNHLSNCILIPHTLLNIRNHEAKVLMINVNDRPQTLSKNTRIGTLSRHSTDSPNRKNICDRCNEYFLSGNDLQIHLRTECYSNQIRKHIVESTKHIDNEKHRLAVQGILWRNKILFDPTPSIINIPPQTAIKTGDHPPIYSKQYSSSYEDQEIKVQKIQKLLERGQIEESTSPWSSSIVLVKKKDKTMIFCIDYRRLNAITIKNTFPLPRIEEILDQLSDAAYYTKFDFKSGYFQVPLSKEDWAKTAFSTRDNHYQFTVLPQGISNEPATFQRLINHILGPAGNTH
ncbi:unnamed protein product [Rotaria magnacalcarata]|uniref:Reverse transcriptase domain-containing protein n=1 Tax=Rotaria magnacalcarata TaxID=392030 RepID=A0A819TLK4_9BILA|nr:unnamed protein product [Rotaria magnacalcarata]